jgi:hypothetical protein
MPNKTFFFDVLVVNIVQTKLTMTDPSRNKRLDEFNRALTHLEQQVCSGSDLAEFLAEYYQRWIMIPYDTVARQSRRETGYSAFQKRERRRKLIQQARQTMLNRKFKQLQAKGQEESLTYAKQVYSSSLYPKHKK